MYQVYRVNEYGQIYNSKGIMAVEWRDDSITKFESFLRLDRARLYCNSYIKRYPQVICEIYHNNEIVGSYRDEEYWKWKEDIDKEWDETKNKMNNMNRYIFTSLLAAVGFILALVSHFMGEFDLPLWLKLVVLPLIAIAGWKFVEVIFARVC